MTQAWRLDGGGQTLVFASDGGIPSCIYWGATLPAADDPQAIAWASVMDVTGGMLDAHPPLSLSPEASRSFPGQPGLVLRALDGTPLLPVFRLVSHHRSDSGIAFACSDAALGLTITFTFDADARTRMLTCRTVLVSDRLVRLGWLAAPVLPAPQQAREMIDFAGRWCGEFQPVASQWSAGIRLRESRTGRSGPADFPGLILPCLGATNCHGEAFAFHYGWSGGHRMVAEELADGRRQIQFGHAVDTEIAPGTRFESAPLYVTHSTTGLNGCAVAFQRHIRDRIVAMPDPARPRPVHYNSWESVYFRHDLTVLKDIATRAARLGAERFVLDDGWFGQRDDDRTSLGDWTVDARKYPDGLAPLIEHVHAEGMSFGLWFEPEMVSPDSDLYRAHPDWTLGPDDQTLGRHQMVLDMSRAEVRDHLYAAIAAILSAHAIDYVKWDHNRVLPAPYADQARGTYALLDRLRVAFPGVEIESCASGGGRIDAGILARTHRVWLSDSNDALERLRIQHDAALFLPGSVTGSHVGPRRCHTSGRTLDMAVRAWTAAQRHMGFEMDPRELTEEEATTLRAVTQWWKDNRHWTMRADILRLDSADPAVLAEQQMAEDGSRFVVFAAKVMASAQIAPRPLRLTALDPAARYSIALRDTADPGRLSRGAPALKSGLLEASGAWLMSHGLYLPCSFPETIWVVEGQRIADPCTEAPT